MRFNFVIFFIIKNRQTWSSFSTISPLNPEMEDSQFCINDDIEGI